jgi:hypothetical protein
MDIETIQKKDHPLIPYLINASSYGDSSMNQNLLFSNFI